MSKPIIGELRALHTNVGGAIEILDLLVEENATVLLKEWAQNLFKMAIEIELRASALGSNNPQRTVIVSIYPEVADDDEGSRAETQATEQ